VGVNDDQCLNCGRQRPGLLAQSRILTALAQEGAFTTLVLWACGALYLASVAVNLEGIAGDDVMSFLSPAPESLFLFGASGSVPVFHFGRFWTVLSAGWLHGGLLHILFNLMWVRNLAPVTAHLYGTSRTVIIYTVASATGFLASSLAGQFLPFLPSFLHGAGLTIGASASIFGLMGALLHYGHRSGSHLLTQQVKAWALGGVVFGFLMPGIDNWAHGGGFLGGYLVSRWLDPAQPERGDHNLAALLCLALSLAAVLLSVVTGLPLLRPAADPS
jgi:rhomboid protease GluP